MLQVESSSVVFFKPSSPYFLNTILISAALLFIAVACGLFYQAFCYRQSSRETGDEGIYAKFIIYVNICFYVSFVFLFLTTYPDWLIDWLVDWLTNGPTD